MLKNKIWLGIILSIILLISSMSGYAFYNYTQQSGTDYFVGIADKSDALEDTIEVREILDALGKLLGHSQYGTTYPKVGGTTSGYLGRLNYGVDASRPAIPVVNDVYLATDTVKVYKCFVAGNWVQVYPITEVDPTVDTDAKIKAILVDEVTKTGAFTAGKIAKINNATGIIEMATNTDAQVSDAVTKAHAKNADTDLESAFEATFVKKTDTVNVLSDITSSGANIEDAVTKKHTQNTDTALGIQTQDLNMGTHKIIGVVDPVNPQEAATKAYADTKVATEVDPTVDSDAEIKAILVDEVTKAGAFTAGRIAKINNATGIIEQGTNTDTDVADAVTKKHSQNTDTDLNATFEATFVKKADTVNVLSDITSSGANIEDAVTKRHTSGSETLAGDVSGTVGTNTVNKIKGHEVDETAIANNKILVYKTTGDKFVYETQTGGVDTSGTPEANDIARFTDADTIEGINYTELKTALALSSANLSDVASIAMLDENEVITGGWDFSLGIDIIREDDAANWGPYLFLKRSRDGDPTLDVSSGDMVADITFYAYHSYGYSPAAEILVWVDGTPGDNDMPGRLEFRTTPDGSGTGVLRLAIDNAGNIKMGDGAWTNYVNVSAGGAMTAEGTASIKATDLVFTNALASDNTYSGEVDSQPVGEAVAFGDLLYFNWTDKEWKKTDADAVATMPGLRIALETKSDGQTCLMLVKGYIRDDSAFEFAGAMIYTSVITGAMSSTAPTGAGDQIQRVGQAKSADILFFNPSIDVGEI